MSYISLNAIKIGLLICVPPKPLLIQPLPKSQTLYTQHQTQKSKFTAEARGEVVKWMMGVKVAATDIRLKVTSGLCEMTRSQTTASKVDLGSGGIC